MDGTGDWEVASHSETARRNRALSDASSGHDGRDPVVVDVFIPRTEHDVVDAAAEAGVERQVGRKFGVVERGVPSCFKLKTIIQFCC